MMYRFKNSLLIISLILFSSGLHSQTKVVTGEFTAFNRYPIKNLKVVANKAKTSAMTDSLGHFTLVCKTKDVIKTESEVFSKMSVRVGKETTDIGTKNLVFIDNPRNRELATGYGYINENDLTFAMSHLDYENNDFCNYNNIYDLFPGRFAGVTVQTVGGKMGVYIRGINSINLSSEALYVVDNVPMENIDHILPCEVKSIDIIKDGAGAIYGARGANGVVIIETKRW